MTWAVGPLRPEAMCSAFGAVLTEEALVKGRDPPHGQRKV